MYGFKDMLWIRLVACDTVAANNRCKPLRPAKFRDQLFGKRKRLVGADRENIIRRRKRIECGLDAIPRL